MTIKPKTLSHHFSLLNTLALRNVYLGCSCLFSTQRSFEKLVGLVYSDSSRWRHLEVPGTSVAALAEGGGGINIKPF